MECQFAVIYFRVLLAVPLASMEICNFCSDLFLRKYLRREYCENKLLAKLNKFTVNSKKGPLESEEMICHMTKTTKPTK